MGHEGDTMGHDVLEQCRLDAQPFLCFICRHGVAHASENAVNILLLQ